MNKFQARIVRFSHLVKEEAGISLFILCVFGPVVSVIVLFASRGHIVTLLPCILAGSVLLIAHPIYGWGCSKFMEVFHCFPGRNGRIERLVLHILKEKAIALRDAYNDAELVTTYEPQSLKDAKKSFWAAHLLAKTFGFPVFTSWKTHANFKA